MFVDLIQVLNEIEYLLVEIIQIFFFLFLF